MIVKSIHCDAVVSVPDELTILYIPLIMRTTFTLTTDGQTMESDITGNQQLRDGRTQTPGPKFLVVIEIFLGRNLRSVPETALFPDIYRRPPVGLP
jgi:hypothetical protein